MSDQARNFLLEIANTVIQLVASKGAMGFPSGELYASLMVYMSLDSYNQFMDAIVASGKLRREGFLYFKV